MILTVGPGKELKITKEVVRHILGLASKGQSQSHIDWIGKVNEANRLRRELGVNSAKELTVQFCLERIKMGGTDNLTKCCFYMVNNRLIM